MSNEKIITVASLARELKIDPKLARRRMRANAARANDAKMKTPTPKKTPSRANRVYEYADTKANREMLTAIIKPAD